VLLAAPAIAAVAAFDLHVKAAALAAGGTGLDVPTSVARTGGAAAMGMLALLGVFVLPSLCLPGTLLFVGGAVSNHDDFARLVNAPAGGSELGGRLATIA
jgi:hypothetical protein